MIDDAEHQRLIDAQADKAITGWLAAGAVVEIDQETGDQVWIIRRPDKPPTIFRIGEQDGDLGYFVSDGRIEAFCTFEPTLSADIRQRWLARNPE